MRTLERLFSAAERRWLQDNYIAHAPRGIALETLWEQGVYIFGAGFVGQEIASCLQGEARARGCAGRGFLGFIDNNPARHTAGTAASPAVVGLQDVPKEGVYICAASSYAGEMARQCYASGYRNVIFPADIAMFFVTSTGMTESWEEVDANTQYADVYQMVADDTSREVLRNLIRFKLTMKREVFAAYSHDDMYFPAGLHSRIDYRHMVDCGAYDGDTFRLWRQRVPAGQSYQGFEPSPAMFARLEQTVAAERNSRFRAYPWGLSNRTGTASFYNADTQAGTCHVAHALSSVEIPLKRYDDIWDGNEITFFKADVEAAEPEVLQGAREAITATRPSLAICVYHAKEHLWQIPEYILSLSLSCRYKIFLRHHDNAYCETVCYAL